MDIYKVIREGKTFLLISNLILSSFQHKIGKKLDVKPGAEMVAAIESAELINSKIELIDRDIQVTLKRTWGKLGFFKKIRLFNSLLMGVFASEEIGEEEIENLKKSDALAEAMNAFGKEIPDVKATLIDERDQYMASHLTDIEGEHIVAIVGAGHVPGMKTQIGKSLDRETLMPIPPPSKVFLILKWLIPTLVLGLFAYGFYKGPEEGIKYISIWVLANGIPSAIGTLLAGGKIVSILTAFVAAPITSLNPMIGASMVVGMCEAYFRKPKVEDLMGIHDAFENLKTIYQNAITRILLVAAMSGFGSAVGTYTAIYLMANA